MDRKSDEMVLVADRVNLEKLPCFRGSDGRTLSGFQEMGQKELEEILALSYFAARHEVEEDPSRKQIIPYTVVRAKAAWDDSEFQFLSYQRAGGEKRLTGLRSIGFGGHVNPDPRQEILV